MTEPLRLANVGVLSLAVVVNLGVIRWVRARDRGRAAELFVLNVAFATLFAAGGILETLVPGRMPKETVAALRYVPMWAGFVAWTGFALHYAGREHLLTRRRRVGLVAVAAFWSGLTATNPIHGLVFEEVGLDRQPFPHLSAEPTVLYWAGAITGSALLLGSVVVLGLSLLNSRRVSRRQPLLLAVGIVPAVVLGLAQSAGILPSDGFEYVSVAGAATSIVYAYALFGEGLFAVAPVSRAAVIESVTDAVVVLDGRMRLIDFNAAATAVGVSEGDIGRHVSDVLPGLVADGETPVTTDGGASTAVAASGTPAERDREPVDSARPIAGDAGIEGIVRRFTTRTGTGRREFVVQPSVVGDADDPEGYVLALRDVTEVEAYAARLRRQTEQLDSFASTVSHDLRNPLSVARGYVETAAETGETEHLEAAVEALDRADGIIEESLTLARQGRAIENREEVSLGNVARGAWSTAETGGATLAVETDRTLSADPDRLTTLLENLFRNAVEHGEADRVRVADRGTGDGFLVADDGCGLPGDGAERVFERGYTTSPDGTGLGLATVESIADAHGWTVEAGESEDGGARFSFGGIEPVDAGGRDPGTDRSEAVSADPTVPLGHGQRGGDRGTD